MLASDGAVSRSIFMQSDNALTCMALVLAETTQSSVLVTVETRKGFGRETDTTREIETHGDSVTQRAQEIETGFVGGTEK
jgi:hypothetical protein